MQNLTRADGARNLPYMNINSLPERLRPIVFEEADRVGLTVSDLMGPSSSREATLGRWRAWARMRALRRPDGQQFSLPQIGRWFGRDHTTVIHGLRRIEEVAS